MPEHSEPRDEVFLAAVFYQTEHNESAPAAGADFALVLSAGIQRFQVMAISATLVTDANVANRQVRFSFELNSIEYIIAPAPAVQAAGATVTYVASVYRAPLTVLVSGFQQCALPYMPLITDGWTMQTVTENIQVGDQWGDFNFISMEVNI